MRRRLRYLSDAELASFMSAVRARRGHRNHERDKAFFELLSVTGLRPSEAIGLVMSDLHLAGKQPWIRVRRLKKRRESFDELVIPDTLAGALRRYAETIGNDPSGRLFALRQRSAQRVFHYYARVAGITRKTHLYMLRHTAATRVYRATHDIELVRALLGHDSADTTAIYAHVTTAMQTELAEKFKAIV